MEMTARILVASTRIKQGTRKLLFRILHRNEDERIQVQIEAKGEIKTCTIKRGADGWYLIFAVEEGEEKPVVLAPDVTVGVDVGLKSFASLSTREEIDNPHFLSRGERELKVETWGKAPEPKPSGKGLQPEKKQPQPGWHYLQVVQHREGSRVVEVKVEVIYGDETTLDLVGAQTSYVEHANLTSRRMNGRLARKTLPFSKELETLKASSIWEDAVYNLTREVKTLRV
jgi:hypothetical protein